MTEERPTLAGELGGHLDRPLVRQAVLAVFGIASTLILANRSPLGWDEAVYAARGKDLVDSSYSWAFNSGTYWSDVRAPGLPMLLAFPFQLFGSTDVVARAVVVVFSLAAMYVMARILDLFFTPRVGTFAVVLIALCPGYLATSTLAFADMPAIFFGMVGVYLLARWFVDADSRALFLIPLAFGAATTTRFGAMFLVAGPLLVVGVAIIIASVRTRDWQRLITLGLITLASMAVVAFLLASRILTKTLSPLDATKAIRESNNNPRSQWIDDLSTILQPGPVDYGFNGAFWGWSFAITFGVLAVAAVLRLLVRRQFLLIFICGVVSVAPIVLYAVSVNQFVTTYLAPIYAMGAAMVAIGLWNERPAHVGAPAAAVADDDLDADPDLDPDDDPDLDGPAPGRFELPRWLQRTGIDDAGRVVGALALLAFMVIGAATYRGVDRMHDRLWGFEQVRAGAMVADDLFGPNCGIATSRVPQVSFYSECFTGRVPLGQSWFDGVDDEAELLQLAAQVRALDGTTVGVLLLEGASGEPLIDDVWANRIEEKSAIFSSAAGRRVGVIAVEVP